MIGNIAYIIGELGYGGAEKQLYYLVKNIDRNRYRVIIICLSEINNPYGLKLKEYVKIYYLKSKGHYDISRLKQIISILKNERIDIVHSYLHIANGYAVNAYLFTKVRCFIPSYRSQEMKRSIVMYLTDRMCIILSNKIITNSRAVSRFIREKYNVNKSKIHVIPNGIDVEKYKKYGKNENGKEDTIIVGIIGKDTFEKNIDMFIEVAKGVSLKLDNVVYWFIGQGLDNVNRFDIFRDLENKMVFHGVVNDIPEYISSMDIVVSTSRSEGMPNAIMEAMAGSKPVVATDTGGTSELVEHGKTGYIVQKGDINSMVGYVCELASDENKRIALGDKGRIRITKFFSVEKMVQSTENLYSSII